jgi:hypothetical protein
MVIFDKFLKSIRPIYFLDNDSDIDSDISSSYSENDSDDDSEIYSEIKIFSIMKL